MRPQRIASTCAIVLLSIGAATVAQAQFTLDESPNLRRGWTLGSGTAGFLLEHRFEFLGGSGGLINFPTMVVAAGLPWDLTLGLGYTSRSEIVEGHLGGGETEVWLRRAFGGDGRVRLVPQVAYNRAAGSWDGAALAQWRIGPGVLLSEARLHSDLFGSEASAVAVTVGAALSVTRHLAASADVGRVLTDVAPASTWSVGITLRIPASPHTLALHASNVGATTLQGVSRPGVLGVGRTRIGFMFTTPLTGARWRDVFRPGREREDSAAADTLDVHLVEMRDFAYSPAEIRIAPGETVVWINREPFEHTVTGDGWGSELMDEGDRFRFRFDEPGRYEYHCAPHPFMRGVVVVEEG